MRPGLCAGVSARLAYRSWRNLEQVERYAQKRYRHWDQRWLHRREQQLVAGLFESYQLGGSILDVPVGYGRFQRLLARYGPVQAADANIFALRYQRSSQGLARGSTAALAEALPYRDHSFDLVFSLRLLQHIHQRDQRVAILKEFRRVSRGWVLASLYLRAALHDLHRRIVRQPSRITMISRKELAEEVQAAGLQLLQIRSVAPGVHGHRICLLAAEETPQVPLQASAGQ